jgi:hypothetical protein
MPIFGGVIFGFLFVASRYFTLAFIAWRSPLLPDMLLAFFLFSKTLKTKQS